MPRRVSSSIAATRAWSGPTRLAIRGRSWLPSTQFGHAPVRQRGLVALDQAAIASASHARRDQVHVERQVRAAPVLAVVAHEPLDRRVHLGDHQPLVADHARGSRPRPPAPRRGRPCGPAAASRTPASPARSGVRRVVAPQRDPSAAGAWRRRGSRRRRGRSRTRARRASPRGRPGCASSGRAARAGRRGSSSRPVAGSRSHAGPPNTLIQLFGGVAVVPQVPVALGRVAEPRMLVGRVVRDVVQQHPQAELMGRAPPARRSRRASRTSGRSPCGR